MKKQYIHVIHEWVDEVITDLDKLRARVQKAKNTKEVVSIAYHGDVVEV